MIQGLEWIVVLVVVLVLFLWGPEKLPKLARAVGQAKREFEKASREFQEELTRPSTPSSSQSSSQGGGSADIIQIARSLGIETEGKTREQIADEIAAKLKKG
jgi:sec-independent protein translocase protein TatA